jgi:hypothetical protein
MTGWPFCVTNCVDCGVGTSTLGEWYMVNDEVWQQAWAGQFKPWHALPGQQVLCIGCLEKRIGRTLTAADFMDGVEVNDPGKRHMSDRFRDRLMPPDVISIMLPTEPRPLRLEVGRGVPREVVERAMKRAVRLSGGKMRITPAVKVALDLFFADGTKQ